MWKVYFNIEQPEDLFIESISDDKIVILGDNNSYKFCSIVENHVEFHKEEGKSEENYQKLFDKFQKIHGFDMRSITIIDPQDLKLLFAQNSAIRYIQLIRLISTH